LASVTTALNQSLGDIKTDTAHRPGTFQNFLNIYRRPQAL